MNKDKYIKVFFTEEEIEKVRKLSARCGYSMSNYCRNLTLKHKPKLIGNDDYFEILNELREFYNCVKDNEDYCTRYEQLILKVKTKAVS